jgi:multicomponent Na+:H+ antiporter subunit G
MIDESARLIGASVLAGAGLTLLLVGALGVLRFADLYERVHALRAAAFGAPLVLGALAVAAWDWRIAVKLALLAAALALTGPALMHLIAHAAHRSGVEPEARARARPRP